MINFYNDYEIHIVFGAAVILFGVTFMVNEMRQLKSFIRKPICILLPLVSIISFIHLMYGVHDRFGNDPEVCLAVKLWIGIGYALSAGGGGVILVAFFRWLVDYEEHDGMI